MAESVKIFLNIQVESGQALQTQQLANLMALEGYTIKETRAEITFLKR